MSDPSTPNKAERSGWFSRFGRLAPARVKPALGEHGATLRSLGGTAPDAAAGPSRSPRLYRQADNWTDNRFTFRIDRPPQPTDIAGDQGQAFRCFFVTGCYKSGTNWVQNLLNLHPLVNCKGEFHFEAIWSGFEDFTTRPWFLASRPRLKEIATDSMQDLVRRLMYAKTRDKPSARWLGDRTPRKLVEFLPGSPMFNIIRDGRDVMVSWNFHHLRAKAPDRVWVGVRSLAERLLPEFRADPASFDQRGKGFLYNEAWFRSHAKYWANAVLHDLKAAPLLVAGGTPVLQLRYENLHSDLPAWNARLLRHLGLDPSQAEPPSTQTRTLPGVQSPSPSQFMRKGVVGDWRNYFDEQLEEWFRQEAGEVLAAAGY